MLLSICRKGYVDSSLKVEKEKENQEETGATERWERVLTAVR